MVKRKHQHLLSVARALKFQAELPTKVLETLCPTCLYLINLSPTPILHYKTPNELLFKQPPSYQHLNVFGCLAFACNTQPQKTKFEPRSIKCLFLGIPHSTRCCILQDLSTHDVSISRDVQFQELCISFSNCIRHTFCSTFLSSPGRTVL